VQGAGEGIIAGTAPHIQHHLFTYVTPNIHTFPQEYVGMTAVILDDRRVPFLKGQPSGLPSSGPGELIVELFSEAAPLGPG
jgi:hypothetical protein